MEALLQCVCTQCREANPRLRQCDQRLLTSTKSSFASWNQIVKSNKTSVGLCIPQDLSDLSEEQDMRLESHYRGLWKYLGNWGGAEPQLVFGNPQRSILLPIALQNRNTMTIWCKLVEHGRYLHRLPSYDRYIALSYRHDNQRMCHAWYHPESHKYRWRSNEMPMHTTEGSNNACKTCNKVLYNSM